MNTAPRRTTLRDGRPGVSWLTPVIHKGRVLEGNYDIHIRPLTPEEIILENLENIDPDDDI
jgi:hypothetical protein